MTQRFDVVTPTVVAEQKPGYSPPRNGARAQDLPNMSEYLSSELEHSEKEKVALAREVREELLIERSSW